MQLMNDDMDELFRRAAENYPLNTGTADWNEVQKKLLAANNAPPPPAKKYNKSLWLLLLLLPAAWIGFEVISNREHIRLSPAVTKNTGLGEQKGMDEQKDLTEQKGLDEQKISQRIDPAAIPPQGLQQSTVSTMPSLTIKSGSKIKQ